MASASQANELVLTTLSTLLQLDQTADWEVAERLRSPDWTLDDPSAVSDARTFLGRMSEEGDEIFCRAAAVALEALEEIVRGGKKEGAGGADRSSSAIIDLTAHRLSAESGWPGFVAGLEYHGFSERQRAQLILFVSRRPELAEIHVRKMMLTTDETDLLKKLLSFPDVMTHHSLSGEALALFLKHFPSGQNYKLLEFSDCCSLGILDLWDLGEGKFRSNAWIFLDHPDSLIPSLEIAGRSKREPAVSYVAVFPAGDQVQIREVKSRICDLLDQGTLHNFVPGLNELTVIADNPPNPDPDPDSVPVPPIDLEERREARAGEGNKDKKPGERGPGNRFAKAAGLRGVRGGRVAALKTTIFR